VEGEELGECGVGLLTVECVAPAGRWDEAGGVEEAVAAGRWEIGWLAAVTGRVAWGLGLNFMESSFFVPWLLL
jgi:hypothetical protein